MRKVLGLLVLALLGAAAWFLSAPGEAPTVEVQPGDTLGKLAKAHGTTVEQLRAWNDLDGDLIHVGDALQIGPAPARVLPEWPRGGEPELPEVVADAPKAPKRTVRRNPVAVSTPVEDDAPTWAPLTKPVAKACLDATTMADGDASMGRSVGLDPDAVGAVVRGFQTETLRCAADHPDAGGTIELELAIGCDGRVLRADVLDDGVGVPGYAACVADVMTYAAFPAHARDEVVVQVPLIFTAAPSE